MDIRDFVRRTRGVVLTLAVARLVRAKAVAVIDNAVTRYNPSGSCTRAGRLLLTNTSRLHHVISASFASR
jgi:hypothetical protein